MRTYYQILGVREGAGKEEIASAYRRLARKYHPDVPGGNAEIFREIAESHRVLSDPSLRREYNAQLRIIGKTADNNPISLFLRENLYSAMLATTTIYFGIFLVILGLILHNPR
jgi:curved DNA-binding protein CbpA